LYVIEKHRNGVFFEHTKNMQNHILMFTDKGEADTQTRILNKCRNRLPTDVYVTADAPPGVGPS